MKRVILGAVSVAMIAGIVAACATPPPPAPEPMRPIIRKG